MVGRSKDVHVDDGIYCKYSSHVEYAVRSGSLVIVTVLQTVSFVPRLLRFTDTPGKYPDFPERWAAHARRYSPPAPGNEAIQTCTCTMTI